ncbi:phosphotransferase (plasmid) [Coraliomargarita sp. W4R53]
METNLVGGNMQTVVRVDDTVRRVAGEWTPAVHKLLNVLAAAKVDEAPKVLGIDDQSREVLTFIDGSALADAAPDVLWAESILTAAAKLLRRMHDASVPLVSDKDAIWRSKRREPAEVICHNDFAPYNLIVQEDVLSGVIDFDFASPGSRLWDLAYLAYRIIPFAEDAAGADGLNRSQRLAKLIAAYGKPFATNDLVATAALRLDDLQAFTLDRVAQTGRRDFLEHAAMYQRDAERLRASIIV